MAVQKKQQTNRKLSPSLIVAAVVLVIALTALIVALVQMHRAKPSADESSSVSGSVSGTQNEQPFDDFDDTCAYVQIEMQDGGIIILELDPKAAPITVGNFLKLTSSGFYDGLTFHRISRNFVIQGGDPEGTGTGGSDPIKGEFSANGVDNPLKHKRGVISMARRSNDMDSGSCQFFICLNDQTASQLDGNYASFGRVVFGMDVVDRIAATPTTGETPQTKIVMKRVSVLREAKGEKSEN